MKKVLIFSVILMALLIGKVYAEESELINVLKDIPYKEEMMGKRKLIDEDHLLVMQLAIKPGQDVPAHKANSNVHLLILTGEVVIGLDGKDVKAARGDMVPVAFKTLMHIRNLAGEDATFLVFKTPNPSEMK